MEYVKLGDICIDMHQGINTVADKVEYKNYGVPIIQSKNITNGYLDLDDVRYLDEDAYIKYKEKYNPRKDEILLCNIGTIGKSLILEEDEKFLIAWNLFKIKINTEEYNSKYIKYYLDNLRSIGYFDRLTTGGTVKFINKKKLEEIKIPVLKKYIQNKIVEVLDKAQELIDKRKEQINELDELVKSRFVEMFGDPALNIKEWDECYYEDICNCITDGEHSTPRRCDKGIYLLSARNVLNHKLRLEDVDFIDQEEYERISKRIIPEEGDILISCSGSVGRVCKVPKNIKFQMVRSVAILKLKENINSVFMEWLIDSNYTQQQILRSINQSSQANLFQGKIKKLKAIVPPIELQNQFADFVKQVDKVKEQMEESLKELEDNFNSLMQKAFKGELF